MTAVLTSISVAFNNQIVNFISLWQAISIS